MSNINYIICNYDNLDESFFQDLGKFISKGYDSTKEFISDGIDNIEEKASKFYHNLINISKQVKSNFTSTENKLRSSGVDVLKLKSLATKEAKKQLFKIKKDEFNIFTFVKLVGNAFNDIFNKCLPKENSIGRQSIVGLTLLAFAYYINTAISTVFILILGPVLGNILGDCIAAPFTEELGKIISINQDAGGGYFIIFNIFEWTLYVKQTMAKVTGLPVFAAIAILRVICVYVHYLWSRIHATHSKTAESRETGMKLGMFYHSIYNLFASSGLGIFYIPIDLYLAHKAVSRQEKEITKNQKKLSINKMVKATV